MQNDYFSFVLINQKTKVNFSITLSRWIIYIILSCLFALSISVAILSYKTYQQRPYKEQLAIIHSNKNHFINLINDLKENYAITDSVLSEYMLLAEYNRINNIAPLLKPVDGIITQGVNVNKRNSHDGLDIATSFKAKIQATQDGIVILSDNIESLGNTVIIAHPNNYYSIYGHLYKRLCQTRDFITMGETIGLVGQANNEEGPHLHFEIWQNNLIIDPRNLIKDYKIKDVSIKE